MEKRSAHEVWEAALGELQIQVSKPNYRTWFQNTTGLSYEGSQFTVGVPNSFISEYLDKNQRSLIEKTLIGLTTADVQVSFQVNSSHYSSSANDDTRPAPAAATTQAPRLNPGYIFDAFVEGNSNRLARAAALAVTENPGYSYNPLFIYGGVGLGKTHLLHAIAHVALTKGVQVVCASAEQFTNEFVTSLRDRKSDEFRNRYRNVGMLLIDDIHFISGKGHTEESFYHTFNELHNKNRQIVVTSNCAPKQIPRLAEKLRSRFEWGLTVHIQPPDFETRLAILQSKARQKAAEVCPDVLEFIAQQMQRNIRELEGSLNRIVAYSRLLRAVPSVELATRALEDIAVKGEEGEEISPTRLLKAAAESFRLSPEDLVSQKRDKETVFARRVAMYLIRQETSYSLAQIGESLGGRDASAVTNACKRISGNIDNNPYLRRKIKEIRQKLSA